MSLVTKINAPPVPLLPRMNLAFALSTKEKKKNSAFDLLPDHTDGFVNLIGFYGFV
jgi:hypothetical protein